MALEDKVEKFKKDDSAALAKILKELEPTFKEVEAARRILPKLDINNLDKAKTIQMQLLAHYGVLKEWYDRIEALKVNKEVAYKQYLKNKAEEKNEKFVSAAAESEASLYVAEERKVRNQISGKLEFVLESIKGCRSLINSQQYPSQASLTA
jgi:ribosome-binding ATPase YchF (GTP1/OBG family)